LPDDYDPDQLLGIRWAYAAQVSVLDRCLEAFLEWWDAQPQAKQTLLVLMGARSYPVGEHARVGTAEIPASATSLHEELIHVPCLMRLPDGAGAADRSQALVQPADLSWTLADWFQLASDQLAPWGQSCLPLVRGERQSMRDRAWLVVNGGEQAIRTPAWHLIVPDKSEVPRKLYAKPDDRWEVNEVADRCSDVADALHAALAEFKSASDREKPFEVSPLADELMRGLE
jgi:arylsulfatase A-like enzyme